VRPEAGAGETTTHHRRTAAATGSDDAGGTVGKRGLVWIWKTLEWIVESIRYADSLLISGVRRHVREEVGGWMMFVHLREFVASLTHETCLLLCLAM